MLPHVMHSVEELSVVSDLNNWGNCNVQFIGKLSDSDDGVYSTCVGIEPNINKNPSSTTGGTIRVDFSLSAQDPPRGVPVRIWGELETKIIQGRTVPIVRAKIVRIVGSVDLPLYRKAMEIRLEYTPHFAAASKGKG